MSKRITIFSVLSKYLQDKIELKKSRCERLFMDTDREDAKKMLEECIKHIMKKMKEIDENIDFDKEEIFFISYSNDNENLDIYSSRFGDKKLIKEIKNKLLKV